MHRRVVRRGGTFLLAFVVAVLVGRGHDAVAEPAIGVAILGLGAAGLLGLVGGLVDAVAIGSRTIPWNVLVGASMG